MLEESRMDKKSINRSTQPQSRASAIDCKKSTDTTHKPWPRNNKKREGSNNVPKNEPYRKNVSAQRGRGQVDRRPRARGPLSLAVGGTPNTGLEDDEEPEIGSVFVPGSKKQNLNHLLNFMYPSRGGPNHKGGLERRGPPVRRFMTHRLPRYENDLYLRAYCQFVVKEDGDYKANLLDPDMPVNWEQIEEIVVRSSGRSECPICLGAPVAGRVGRCGHVYCWACVLHYAATHEKQPPPCPVCTTAMQVDDMKPTIMLQWESPAEEVTMRLVRRQRGSTTVEIAPPRGQITDYKEACVLPLDQIDNAPYSKFFAASKQQVQEILDRERKEINDQILAEIDTSEIVFLEQALGMLKLKEDKLDAQFEMKFVEHISKDEAPIVYEKQEVNEQRLDWFDVTEEGAACSDIIKENYQELNNLSECNLNPEAIEFVQSDLHDDQPEEFPLTETSLEQDNEQTQFSTLDDIDKENQAKYFYFYQAEDGQQVFLNSLNIRVLNASWGALPAAPPLIKGRVLHRETLSLGEQTRKHMPYTAHLPLYCSFDIVELDLQPPYVTPEALNNFSDELEKRARIRARHEREERRRDRAYRRAMEGPPKPDFSSELMFPPAPPSHSSPPLTELCVPPLDASPSTSGVSPSGLSFAKMASTSGTWRVRNTAQPPLPTPQEDEDGASAPRTLSLSDAIEAALHAKPASSGKKSKKSKQKVLFSMGMQHTS